MSLSLLRTIAERVARSGLVGDRFTVVWHGGEPLVMPIAFYESAIEIFDAATSSDTATSFAFQTNATLINEDWCRFFENSRTAVGVSIDGPEALHDAHRKTRHGKGTLAATLAGMRMLQSHDIRFNVITVLTSDALEYPDEMLDFFVEQGITRVGFNIEELEGVNQQSSLNGGDSEQRFRRFLKRFIRLSHNQGWPVHIRELEQLLALLIRREKLSSNEQTTPFRLLNVAWDGSVGTFSPELLGAKAEGYPDFLIGNIGEHEIVEMAAGDRFQHIRSEIDTGVARCRRECGYFDYCGGGAPANKVFENGSFATTETLYCRLMRKAIIDVVLEDIAYFSNLRGFSARSRDSSGSGCANGTNSG
jgi:uncharacterized protein